METDGRIIALGRARSVAGGVVRYWINMIGDPLDHLVELARVADECGFEGLALADHLAPCTEVASAYPGGVRPWAVDDDWPDVWVAVAAMATVTTRLRFVSNVFVLPLREPLAVAKSVATASALSGGRVVFGAGVGWMAEEYAAVGRSFTDRGRRADEMLQILRAAWRDGVVEWHGEHFDFAEVNVRPSPPGELPIWTGGDSGRALVRAAHLADGWISGKTLDDADRSIVALRAMLRDAGRSVETFAVVVSLRREPDAAAVDRHLALGVSDVKVSPWVGGHRAPLADKLAAIEAFAERNIR